MAAQVWASVLSLVGVVLGSGLTALAHHATQRSAERTEERKQFAATAEARRAERLGAIKDFLACAQEAEAAAYRRPEPWGGDEEGWMSQAGATMTALWQAERVLALLCGEALEGPGQAYARALNQAVWRDIGDVEVNEHLETQKAVFMTAARTITASY
ncbi:hypothetical protein [Streptomyces reniochalinae]|uniref:Protein kilB n=1 Tax=Streptomyces reniochalinae TaxID=2250578 RepID=A0A367E7U3_9ACTN|nr:hypothetical protein [Streptomyces reniochalinae]RCG13822.1 hypothetical protein DQ392_30305 [Streptomyces reniochalinae]